MLESNSKKDFNSTVEFLIQNNIKHALNYSMSEYASWTVGATTPLMIYPQSLEEFKVVIEEVKKRKIRFYISGNGSNTLFLKLSRTIVISTKRLNKITFSQDQEVTVECGTSLALVLSKTLKKGLVGFEFSSGIPGTIGGALITNAGANGGTISESLESICFLKKNIEVEVPRNKIEFNYRSSSITRKDIILRAKFKLKIGDTEQARENIKKYIKHRNNTQPVEYPSAGSVFINNKDCAAGERIERLGLKGLSIGGAEVSKLHANYIINTGKATTEDIHNLIKKIQKISLEKEGVALSTEVKIVNE